MLRFKLLIISTILYNISIFAQTGDQAINQTDNKGLKQGKWLKTYSNGNTRYSGEFRDDKPVGEFIYNYESGKLKAAVNHKGDGIHAATKLYAEDGKKIAEGFYFKQQKDSVWNYFDQKSGFVSSVEIYSGTKPTGTWKTFYQADTSIAEITNFSNGVKNGIWQQFFKNGKVKTTGSYVENNLDGLFTGFNPEGQILYKGFYVEGRRAGLWEYYTAAGQLKTKEWYENGEMIKEEVLIPDEPIKDEPLDPSLDPEKNREQGNGGL